MAHVHYLPVFVAAVAVFILGWLWYSPLLFFKPWMRLRGLDPDAAMAGAKMPGGKLLVEFLRCLVLSFAVALFLSHTGVVTWRGAIHYALLTWIAFPVILLIGSILWENVPWKVAAIHAGDWLVKLLVISLIITLWR